MLAHDSKYEYKINPRYTDVYIIIRILSFVMWWTPKNEIDVACSRTSELLKLIQKMAHDRYKDDDRVALWGAPNAYIIGLPIRDAQSDAIVEMCSELEWDKKNARLYWKKYIYTDEERNEDNDKKIIQLMNFRPFLTPNEETKWKAACDNLGSECNISFA